MRPGSPIQGGGARQQTDWGVKGERKKGAILKMLSKIAKQEKMGSGGTRLA